MDPTPGRFIMEKFDGKGDFSFWKYKLLGQLEIQGLSSVLREEPEQTTEVKDGDSTELKEDKVDPKAAEKDVRVRNLLSTCLSDTILRKIMHEPTALGMWRALEQDYQTKSLPNRIYLKQSFASFKMEERKTIEENLDTFLKLIADLGSLKITVSDEDQAIQLLTSLPPAFEPLVHTLKYGTGKETLTVNEVVSSAYAKEAELRQKGALNKSRQGSDGLYVESRGRSDKKGQRGYSNRGKSKDYDRSRSKSRQKFAPKACWVCGDENHWKRDCPQRKQYDKGKTSTSANVALRLPDSIALTASPHASNEDWVLDSGCTFHITPRREVLSDFQEVEGSKVMMGNNTFCMVKGMGTITIDNPDGSVVTLGLVRYMPEMRRNLISYGQLEKSGCNYRGEGFEVQFFKGNQKVLTGKYDQGLYYLQGSVRKVTEGASCSAVDRTIQWHSRLAHMSQSSMEILVRKGYLNREFCEACAMGKSHKQSFPKAKHTTKAILDYVHSDL